MSLIRVDKLLANLNYGSRKEIKKLVSQKRVRIDETLVLKPEEKFDTEKKGVYYNASISEYVSCKILKELGFNVQDVILGTYNGEKVVACKIFSDNDNVLNDFASIKNSYSYKPGSNGYGIELNEVLETIEDQNIIDKNKLLEHFWEMFILDSLLANFDRHNGNWGFAKGHTEYGENEKQTAIREVKEETGLDIEIISDFSDDEIDENLKEMAENLLKG